MSVLVVPERSVQQRLDALAAGNHVRSYRASLKWRIKRGETRITDVLLEPAPELDTMRVADLIGSTPMFGRVKTDALLRRTQISHSKKIGGLTLRQRTELIAALMPYSVRTARRMEA